ncbi:MAG: citrate lyase subunit alpha [Propionibacteriaceae bacterium]|jgi:citrate lyase subunit alpha/citrate CoA-transferase|nr:citrate lyase subunit alpha [Propionibacteriaceae bacterium]
MTVPSLVQDAAARPAGRLEAAAGSSLAAVAPSAVAAPPPPFAGWSAQTPHLVDESVKTGRKLCASLEEAVKRSGLQDGGTISFHHGFREGDKVVLAVVDELARLGYKNLTLASSSLNSCHGRLVEHIRAGVISRVYTSGMRGRLAAAVSRGLMETPVTVHSHGGRIALMDLGELRVDVAFLGVPTCDLFGNANGVSGRSRCGSLGYAMVDAARAGVVVAVAEQIVPYPNVPASILQDQVDLVVQVDEIGDPSKISVGAARLTTNPRELLIASYAAAVMEHSGYFAEGFSMQAGTGASAIATTRYLGKRMAELGVRAAWGLGGITGDMVDLQREGLVGKILDTQDFDAQAAADLAVNPDHVEITASQYANPFAKGAAVDQLDMVILSALEIDLDFNVNVLTGSDGIILGASGGHCDTSAGAKLSIIVTPLLRGRIPMVRDKLTTKVTPGETIGVLVTDHGVAVNPRRPELAERLAAAGLPVVGIEQLYDRCNAIAGKPRPLEFTDRVVGFVRYRDGSVIDTVYQVKEASR